MGSRVGGAIWRMLPNHATGQPLWEVEEAGEELEYHLAVLRSSYGGGGKLVQTFWRVLGS